MYGIFFTAFNINLCLQIAMEPPRRLVTPEVTEVRTSYRNVTVGELQASSSYIFSLYAETGAGRGPAKNITILTRMFYYLQYFVSMLLVLQPPTFPIVILK